MTVEDRSGANANGKTTDSGRKSPRLRHRVAWMYYVEEMTQGAIADRLGIGRITVGRMLFEARATHEVRIALSRDLAELTEAEIELEKKYGLHEAIVVPLSAARARSPPRDRRGDGKLSSRRCCGRT